MAAVGKSRRSGSVAPSGRSGLVKYREVMRRRLQVARKFALRLAASLTLLRIDSRVKFASMQ